MIDIQRKEFGELPDGREVTLFILQNENGTLVEVLNYGPIIRSIQTRDRSGSLDDIILGFDRLEGYLLDQNYLGAFIGRYANRIAGASIEIDGENFPLSKNEGENTHHGGLQGLNQTLWDPEVDGGKLNFRTTSPDGDQGFPGELVIQLSYELSENDELSIAMLARTSRNTVVNFTLHPYFNLSGNNSPDLGHHQLRIFADHFLPIDDQFIPTGEIRAVEGTPFDFRESMGLNESLEQDDQQLETANGFDHCFVLENGPQPIAQLSQINNGRSLEIFSDAPGLQLYTSNHLNGEYPGKVGSFHAPRQAVCLEPQAFPNAPKMGGFPSTILKKNDTYKHTIVYKFGTIS